MGAGHASSELMQEAIQEHLGRLLFCRQGIASGVLHCWRLVVLVIIEGGFERRTYCFGILSSICITRGTRLSASEP